MSEVVRSEVEERVLGTLRIHPALTTMELVKITGFQYPSVYRCLARNEKKNRVTGYRYQAGEQVLWSLNE